VDSVNKGRKLLAIVLGVPSLLFFLLSIMGPVLARESLPDRLLSAICHRMPSRCIQLPWGVSGLCSRCTAFWLGLALGSLAFWNYLRRIPFWLGLAAIVPLLIDGLFQLHTDYTSSNLLRVLTGLAAGTGVAIVFLGFTDGGK
jgi:uncharacterized membrane protein